MLEWDEVKRRANIAKHGVDFRRVAEFEWDSAGFLKTETIEGETRETVVGLIGPEPCLLIYTERGASIRIISLRRASKTEIANWLRW